MLKNQIRTLVVLGLLVVTQATLPAAFASVASHPGVVVGEVTPKGLPTCC